ncbi:class Ib ribonucleoside-diphosphate reductase assembly flavoprotein NrdI [Dermatophilus congolensis]|uniref:Protein NrdI n=1 Tax=Dermatophilus congolensis TaxID=1863 RepID=A0A239VBU3_9MICO|nr:class Ib ribonucleoside-diphosphate reductase assembly flavoprotein NrdI [Dermatophilus congolensis]MBO3130644.1 class Ib ribonucleoside-diphosphate reductase assembly flavoprotein NrdI [Dermatophilus congolensis]MBO3130726.1 class Ib ribonucleoside-diphosphate reductase assembly flavoprotein NrdI [Dermatophilus congolensis]MBO3135117.1 class Ib ribonucleoside-diphosphate reductase assembly flavoprotein NrdI [Dermatophilus congolensis]MBO3137356.1 class Ib ribonucleoside-diphosphate reductas
MDAPAPGADTPATHLVYFSSTSENTHRFVQKLGCTAQRIPLRPGEPHLQVTQPYVLVLPTYGGGRHGGAVPKQVIKFLNDPHNRHLIRGVIAGGNTNFGVAYGLAGDIVAAKCHIPLLYRFELMGTPDDVEKVRERLRAQ